MATFLLGAIQNAVMNTPVSSVVLPTKVAIRPSRLSLSTTVMAADPSTIATRPRPTEAISTRLLPRARNGLGRLLRGTAHTVLPACCRACATPSPPYSAPRMPTTTPVVPLPSEAGALSWSPTTGNSPRAELSR